MASRHDAKLKKLQQLWKKTRSEVGDSTGGFELLPEGMYLAKLVEPKITDDPSKKLQVGFRVEILEGDFAGKKIFHSWNLENEIGMSMFMQFLNLCGYVDFDDLNQLKDIVEELSQLNAAFEIRVKVRDGYNRVSFNNIIEGDEIDDSETEDAPEPKKKTKGKKKPEPEPEEDDEPEDDEPEDDDDEEDDDDDEEEEEEPKSRRRGSKAKDTKKSKVKYTKANDEFLRDLCDGFGVSHRALKNTEDLVEKLKADHVGEFVREDLEDDEIMVLEKLDLEDLIG